MVNWYILASLLTACASFLLGLFVFLRDRKKTVNGIYFLLNLIICAWSFGFAMMFNAPSKTMGLFWARFLNMGAILIPVLFLHFCTFLLQINEKKKKSLITAYLVTSIILVLNLTNLHIKDVAPKLSFKYYPIPGMFYLLYLCMFSYYIVYALSLLFQEYKKSFGMKQNQLRYVLIASIIGFGGSTMLFLPMFSINVPPLGYLFISIYAVVVTYAIIKHRLMDINIVLKKGTINILLLGLMFLPSLGICIFFEKIFLGSINIPLTLIISLLFIVVIYLSPRVKPQVEDVVDRIIFKDKFRYQKTLSDLSKVMVSILDLKLLSQKIIDTLTQEIEIEGASLFIMDEEKGWYYPIVCTGAGCDEVKKFILSRDEPFTARLKKKKDIFIREELRQSERVYAEAMEKMQAEVTIPLLWKDELVGVLNLGHKVTRDMYNLEDLDLLKTLANQATIAIENAKMYDALKKTKSRMQRADRLASLGTLTAGLAHEIRNPLVAVKTFLQLLPEKYDDDEFRNYFLSVASGEVDRISSLVTELLDFSRPSEPQLREENINEILDKMVTLVTTETKKKNLKITRNLGEHLPFIQVDKDQIKQVFLNILLNAVQATPENGEITIVTRSFAKSPGETFLQIEVKDTGPGIPAQELELIFTPFYTTKTQGSGLGLSITHQIVEEHHGYIEVDSQVGSGTSFTINLPLNADSLTEKRQKATVQ